MTDHPVLDCVARGLIPAHNAAVLRQTLDGVFLRLSAVAEFAHIVVQCLRFGCSRPQPSSIVSAVRRVQRPNLPCPAAVRVVSAADATMSSASANMMKVRKPEPAEIEYKNMKFLITYRPTDATMDRFIEVSSFLPIVLLCCCKLLKDHRQRIPKKLI